MKIKLFTAFAAGILLLNGVGATLAGPSDQPVRAAAQADDLIAILPASDGVASLDVKRLFRDTVPQLLAANQPVLAQVTQSLDEMKTKTGFDIRQFDKVVVGFNFKDTASAAKPFDIDPVVVARGDINSGAILGLAKLASNGAYKVEKSGERTIYLFSIKDKVPAAKTAGSKAASAISRTAQAHDQVAVIAWDPTTVVFGSPALVRRAAVGNTHVDPELKDMLAARAAAVGSFSVKAPAGFSKLVPMENDEMGKTLNSIKLVAGSMDVTEGNAIVQVMARTANADSAESLLQTLQGLQSIGKALLGGATTPDKQVYSRLIDTAKLSRENSEVNFDLAIPQSDIDVMIGSIKIK